MIAVAKNVKGVIKLKLIRLSVSTINRPGTTSKFSTRNNAGEVVAKYPVGDVTIDWIRSNEQWEPKIQLHGTPESKLTSKYNYMFSRLRDKYDVLEEQITNMSTLLATKLQIDGFESNSKLNSVVLSLRYALKTNRYNVE